MRRIARARRGETIRATFSRKTWTSKIAAPAVSLRSLREHRPPCTGRFKSFSKSKKHRSRKQSRSRQEGDGSLDLDKEKRSRYLRAHRFEFENPRPAAPLRSLRGHRPPCTGTFYLEKVEVSKRMLQRYIRENQGKRTNTKNKNYFGVPVF